MGQNIGVFDSGIGGLSIYREIKKLLPNRGIIYFSDHKNAPYGTKTQKEIKKLTEESIGFLIRKNCDPIVIACNTAITSGIDYYRQRFPGVSFVGAVPPIKPAAITSESKNIIILSTTATAKSKYLNELINEFASNCKVWNFGCPELVEAIESGTVGGEKTKSILKKYLDKPLKDGADVIVLGCTHFPFLKDAIYKLVGRKVKVLEPSKSVAKHVQLITKKDPLKRAEFVQVVDEFYTSEDPNKITKIASKLLKSKIELRNADLILPLLKRPAGEDFYN